MSALAASCHQQPTTPITATTPTTLKISANAASKKVLEKSESSPPPRSTDVFKMVAASNGNSGAGPFHSTKEHHHSGGSESQDNISSGSKSSKLSKIGRRLRDSCRNFRSKSHNSNGSGNSNGSSSHNPEDYTSIQAPNESFRSKNFAPMDFSGQSGRIIDHRDMDNGHMASTERPQTKESCAYFRRKIDTSKVDHLLTETQANIHHTQPWFHKGISRQLAQKILAAHASDGLFLVRDSSVAGGYVISYFFSGKTYHTQVLPIVTPEERVTYSLDNGRTRFFDLLQMVEYYQLNRGTLNHRLTHYIVSKSISGCHGGSGSSNGGPANGKRPESPTARSDSSSYQGTSDGSIDSQTSTNDVCSSSSTMSTHGDEASSTLILSTTPKIDSNHNNSIGNFSNIDVVSEASSTMSDGETSVATAVDGRQLSTEEAAVDDDVIVGHGVDDDSDESEKTHTTD